MVKKYKLNSKLTGTLQKEEAINMPIEIGDDELLYHGTSEKRALIIDKDGLCSTNKKVHNISEEGIYLTTNIKEATHWAEYAKATDKSKDSFVYTIKGKDINKDCMAYPDWNIGFIGKLDSIVLFGCDCISSDKLKDKKNTWDVVFSKRKKNK